MRFLVVKAHYRSPIDYSEKLISQTKRELEKIDEFLEKIRSTKSKIQTDSKFQISKYKKEFETAMEDDFNTPEALAVVFDLINEGNSLIAEDKLSKVDAKEILSFLKRIDVSFGFILEKKSKKKIPETVLKLIKEREECRKKNQWQKADELRKKIKESGFLIEDTKGGPKIKKISNF